MMRLPFFYQRGLVLFFCSCLAFFLASCAQHKKRTLTDRLNDCGVQIVHVGETMRLIVPTHQLFHSGSANIQISYYRVLKNIAQFLRRYKKIVVTVTAYTNPAVDYKYSRALSRQQADNIVTYLWHAGIDARVMHGVGRVKHCSTGCINRRIEISFRYFPRYLGLN